MAAQIVHAAGESSPGSLPSGTFAIVLAAPDEAALLSHEDRLRAAGVAHVAIRENEGPFAGQLCAIGLRPAPRSSLRRWTSSVPLLK